MSDLRSDDAIAVIGLACRLPGARNAGEFWRNLTEGADSVRFLSDAQLQSAGVAQQRLDDPDYVRACAEPDDLAGFDADLFGFTPRDATHTDPQIRIFLEVVHAAMENAGYDPYQVPGVTAVYGSMGGARFAQIYLDQEDHAMTAGRMSLSVLNMPDYLSTLISYKFGFQGPSMTVYSACSSSLVATHLAAQALRAGECDVAVAGGTDVVYPIGQGYVWSEGGPISRDGRCRPFDVSAGGTIFSSGAGAVILRRLDDALEAGDEIRAVILGSAVNNDGSTKVGFTAPGVSGQAAVIQEAMMMAGLSPADISYVEAHSTGTPLGDPVELAGLTRAYAALGPRPAGAERIPVSSVKGNVGHLGHAAGIASLIKLVLCLENEQRVGTANFTEPNPQLQLETSPFTVTTGNLPWPRSDRPRAAGVSALGFGGTNAHMVLTEGPPRQRTPADGRPQVLVFSGRTAQAADDYRRELAGFLAQAGDPIADVAGTLQLGRTHHRIRCAVVAQDAATAREALEQDRLIATRGDGGAIAFLFPGQAAQQPAMARGLYPAEPAFTEAMDECLALFAGQGVDLADAWRDADADAMTDTLLAQPLLFSVEYALARMWRAFGVEPAFVLGHSIGELAAATVAGIFDLPSAVLLVTARAAAMGDTPPGGMLGVAVPADTLNGLLPAGVSVAVTNGPRQTVVSGSPEALAAAADVLAANKISFRGLPVGKAFHSPLMSSALPRFQEAFGRVQMDEPHVTMISAATGQILSAAEAKDPAFWAAQICGPVRFDRALATLVHTGAGLLVEAGPGHTLSQLARSQAAGTISVPTLPREAGNDARDLRALLSAAATVWAEGHTLDWLAVRGGRSTRRVPVPGYQYQRVHYWPAAPGDRGQARAAGQAGTAGQASPDTRQPVPLAGTGPFSVRSWTERARPPRTPQSGVALAVLPEGDPALPTTLALQQAGYRVVIARVGDGYRSEGGDLRIRPDSEQGVTRLLADLATRGSTPALIVHALATAPGKLDSPRDVDLRLEQTFHSLHVLAKHALRCGARLTVLTACGADITGAEPLDPFAAMLTGAVASLAAETSELDCRLIDVGPAPDPRELGAELATTEQDLVVALRGPGRWIPVERPWTAADPGALPLRRGGLYLLTGGLGGLGMVVARALAGTGLQPTLVLAGRHGAPAGGLTPEIAALETLGAQVRIETCDIADRRAVRRLADTLRAHVGPVNGIVHLAGVAGDGMLVVRDKADTDAVLRPKVHGSLVLGEVFGPDRSLDFYLAFSSRAALSGLVGGGDYAAANAFLDAHTRLLARGGLRAQSVNWPAWSTVGMAATQQAGPGNGALTWAWPADPAADPILDEHRTSGVPLMPGAAVIDAAMRAYRELVDPADAMVRFDDIVFRRPMVAPRRREAQITLYRDEPGWRFEYWSAADDGLSRTVHATGRIGPLPQATAVEPLADVRGRLTEPVPELPAPAVRLFALGPRWSDITETETTLADPAGTAERLSELVLPDAYAEEAAGFPLYPPLLDRATSASRSRALDGAYVPFHYGSLEVYGRLPAHCFSHIRPQPAGPGLIIADVTVYGADGQPLAVISGYTMRRLAGAELPEAAAATAGAATGGAARRTGGIDPDEGARLFLSLLKQGHPPNVAVRPYAEGRYLPLHEADGPATAPPGVAGAEPREPAAAPPQAAAAPPQVAAPPLTAAAGSPPSERLAALWAEVLGITAIRPSDDFFELGGNSLVAVELITRIRDTFGVAVSIVTLFEHTRLDALARALTELGGQ